MIYLVANTTTLLKQLLIKQNNLDYHTFKDNSIPVLTKQIPSITNFLFP